MYSFNNIDYVIGTFITLYFNFYGPLMLTTNFSPVMHAVKK